jgi:hypothetical protein
MLPNRKQRVQLTSSWFKLEAADTGGFATHNVVYAAHQLNNHRLFKEEWTMKLVVGRRGNDAEHFYVLHNALKKNKRRRFIGYRHVRIAFPHNHLRSP